MTKTKNNNIAGITRVYGEEEYASEMGASLILSPLKGTLNETWNTSVNRAVNDKDVDSLADMALIIMKRRDTEEYDKLMLDYAQEYLK